MGPRCSRGVTGGYLCAALGDCCEHHSVTPHWPRSASVCDAVASSERVLRRLALGSRAPFGFSMSRDSRSSLSWSFSLASSPQGIVPIGLAAGWRCRCPYGDLAARIAPSHGACMGCFLAGIVYIVVREDRQRIDAGEYRKVSDASS